MKAATEKNLNHIKNMCVQEAAFSTLEAKRAKKSGVFEVARLNNGVGQKIY